ncbi:MAG: hypothetical protein AB8G14_07880 [Ilumatobacter sp.]
MTLHTFHLATTRLVTTAGALLRAPANSGGLRGVECLTTMPLGVPIASPARARPRHFAMFAAWDHADAVDEFLASTDLGAELAHGWHVRMSFVRRWGSVAEWGDLPASNGSEDAEAPTAVLTLARLKLNQLPRFAKWGKPVEQLVRDHPATTMALAATRPIRTAVTFSMWRTEREMIEMVHGATDVPAPARHAAAMEARRRKDFHREFTTLRFRPLSEHGAWDGRNRWIPDSPG